MSRIGLIAAVAMAATGARADFVSHAIVRYGDTSFTVDEHFGTASAAAELLYSSPGLFHGAAEAAAEFGSVHATATVLGIVTAYPINASQAEAAFSDLLTISGPSGTGFVVYTYSVNGWAEGELSLGALFLRHGADPDEELGDEIGGGEVLASEPHGIVFGQAFSHGVMLQANGGMGLGETGEFGSDLTAVMTGLEVFDSAMNPIAEFTVGSLSGTQYPVPGPGGLLILPAAAALMGRRRQGGSAAAC